MRTVRQPSSSVSASSGSVEVSGSKSITSRRVVM
jgi:hypothetical protein